MSIISSTFAVILQTISDLTYVDEPGAGTKHGIACHHSQSVTIGSFVKCSGQGGWDDEGNFHDDGLDAHVQRAMGNVGRVLQASGLTGWDDVYNLRTYHSDIATSFPIVVEKLKERIPGHRPCWTCIGVTKLAFADMLIEVEVDAVKQG